MSNALGVFVYLASYVAVAIAGLAFESRLDLGGVFLVVVFVAATSLNYVLTKVWPRGNFHEAKRAVLTQTPITLFAYLSTDIVVRPISWALAWWIASLAPAPWGSTWARAMNETPPILLFLACLFFYEALGYWQHRIFHAIPVLWRISHTVHHEATAYGPALSLRVHYLEYFATQMTRLMIFTCLQVDSFFILLTVSASIWGSVLQHANTCLRFGWINYIVLTPETHVWHHDPDKRVNYGTGILSLFDWLFGTFYYRPQKQPARIGIYGIHTPRSFFDIVMCRSPRL